MKAKYKMTGCARFLIFLVILIPIAYFGSKYLRDSGTWDKIKDKVENNDSNSIEQSIENKSETLDPRLQDLGANERYNRLRKAYDEQEALIKQQAQTISELQAQIKDLQSRQGTAGGRVDIPPATQQPPTRPTTSPGGNSPSLDDLLQEADMSTTGTSGGSSSTSGTRQTIGKWTFSFSGTQGNLEFYQQNGKLMSRITVDGNNAVTIDELSRSGQDRFNVVGSQTGEYYILKNNGDLDAYDRNGYQTTCRYVN